MRLDPDQLEWIVNEVVRRLREESAGESPQTPSQPGAHIILTQSLITTATLVHKLDGVARLSVPARAVVTPSARDLLKERNIELVRTP